MPSEGVGSLYGGLAQGIFGRLREREDEQRRSDAEQKGSTLKYLSSLVDEATPETRPILLNTMAETIGLKGKHRGVWDMLTGGGRDDYHQQLSGLLAKTTGNIVGPEKYEQLRKQGVIQDMGAAFRAGDPSVRSSEPLPTEGKIALRDPDQIALEKLRNQYGLKFEADMRLVDEKDRRSINREVQNDDRDYRYRQALQQDKAYRDSFKPVMERAQALSGSMIPTPEALEQAAQEHATKLGLDIEKLRETIPGLKARTYRDTQMGRLAESQIGQGVPGTPGYGLTPNQQANIDIRLDDKSDAVASEWTAAKAELDKLNVEQETLRERMKQIEPMFGGVAPKGTYQFDESNEGFYNPKTKKYEELVSPEIKKQIGRIKEIEALKAGLLTRMKTAREKLKGNPAYDTSDEWSLRRTESGRVAPTGAPRTSTKGQPPPFPQTSMPGQTNYDPNTVAEGFRYRSKKPVANGTEIGPFGGKMYKVVGILGKEANGDILYQLEPMQ